MAKNPKTILKDHHKDLEKRFKSALEICIQKGKQKDLSEKILECRNRLKFYTNRIDRTADDIEREPDKFHQILTDYMKTADKIESLIDELSA